MLSKKLLLTTAFFLILHTLSAYTPGSTIRVELRNGSVIIGKVVRTGAGSAWIKTRYGIFRVRIQTVKRKTVLKKAPAAKTPIMKTNTETKKSRKKGNLEFSFSLLPASGEAGDGLNPGFSAAAACWLESGTLRPGFSLLYNRFSGNSLSGSLTLITAEAGLRLNLLSIKNSRLYMETRAGAALAIARLNSDNSTATGLRPTITFQAGYILRISNTLSLTLSGGWGMVYESKAILHSFPIRLGAGIDF